MSRGVSTLGLRFCQHSRSQTLFRVTSRFFGISQANLLISIDRARLSKRWTSTRQPLNEAIGPGYGAGEAAALAVLQALDLRFCGAEPSSDD